MGSLGDISGICNLAVAVTHSVRWLFLHIVDIGCCWSISIDCYILKSLIAQVAEEIILFKKTRRQQGKGDPRTVGMIYADHLQYNTSRSLALPSVAVLGVLIRRVTKRARR